METEPPALPTDRGPGAHSRLLVPRTDRTWLMSPSASDAANLVQSNIQALAGAHLNLQGTAGPLRMLPASATRQAESNLDQLRRWTRHEVLRAACDYTRSLGAAIPDQLVDGPWIVGGHQPTLFHPGVWAKNFALGRLAHNLNGISLNLVVDNDTMASQSIKVPTGTRDEPRIISIPFDAPRPPQPWEEVTVQDESLFESLGDRVLAALQGWNYPPLITDFWPRVVAQQKTSPLLVDCFTAARNEWEREWGVTNLELPLSRLCRLPPFLWFVSHLVSDLPRFWSIYNQAVHDYRRRNRIRNTSHPVPDLAQIGDWLEAPFWIWKSGDRRRSRLFARRVSNQVELSVEGHQPLSIFAANHTGDCQEAIEQLDKLQAAGWHLRTRALTTTLFTRVCLADLFVHGIGGAKYDEITDDLVARFLELPVPRYWTVTGTLHLPIGHHPVSSADLDQQYRLQRDLKWNPARAFRDSVDPNTQRLCREFDTALTSPHTVPAERRSRHVEFTRIKSAMAPQAHDQVPLIEARIQSLSSQLKANRILQDREYAYVLYPADKLRQFLTADAG